MAFFTYSVKRSNPENHVCRRIPHHLPSHLRICRAANPQQARLLAFVPGTSAIVGHEEADVMSQEEDKKAMMLQRFQKENPGFDFSGT